MNELIPFPSHTEEKTQDWIKKYTKACWSDFNSIQTESFYKGRVRYNNIQSYMIGRQDIVQYLKTLDIDMANVDESALKIPKKVLSILSKYARMMVATLSKNDYNVNIQAIDPLSIEEDVNYYAQNKARMLLRDEFIQVGLDPSEMIPDTDEKFESEEELELHMEYRYKNKISIDANKAIRVVLNNCKYDSIKEFNIKQLVYFGFCGLKDYFDQNGDIKVRSVDVNNFIVSRATYEDFKDALYMGEVLDLSIADLREMDIKQEITKSDYDLIAKRISNSIPNSYNTTENRNVQGYEGQRVQLLDIEFYSTNECYIEEGLDKNENRVISRKSKIIKKSKDNTYYKKEYKVVYEAKWVVGTDIFFGCKLQTNMKRPKSNISDVSFSYNVVAPMLSNMNTISIGENMITVQDMIQLAWMKYQDVLISAKKKGILMEIGAMENIPLGKAGIAFTPVDGFEFYKKTGSLFYRAKDDEGKNTNYKPITELENGLGDEAQRYFAEIQNNISLLQQMTGYNELTDGSTPDSRTLNGVAKMASESTNNSIYFMKKGERMCFEQLMYSLVIRIQDAAKSGNLSGYINSIGKKTIEFFSLSPDVSMRELGIIITDQPDAYAKETLKERINLAIQSGQITIADAFMVEQIIDINHAEAMLSIKIRKNKEAEQKINLQNIEANSRTQQESAQQAFALKQQELEMEKNVKLELLVAETDSQLQQINAKYNFELQLKEMEVTGRVEQNNIQAKAKEYVADRGAKSSEAKHVTKLQNDNLQQVESQIHEEKIIEKEKEIVEKEELVE
ncbi:MAG: hypothetical protein ACRCSG_05565 [Cellulosilyticaceae bacterium]